MTSRRKWGKAKPFEHAIATWTVYQSPVCKQIYMRRTSADKAILNPQPLGCKWSINATFPVSYPSYDINDSILEEWFDPSKTYQYLQVQLWIALQTMTSVRYLRGYGQGDNSSLFVCILEKASVFRSVLRWLLDFFRSMSQRPRTKIDVGPRRLYFAETRVVFVYW